VHGFAAMAIPTYAVAEIVYAAALCVVLASGEKRRGVLFYLAGLATVCALYSPWLVRFDAETLRNVYTHVRTEKGWSYRLQQFANQFRLFVPPGITFALLGALALLVIAIRRRIAMLEAVVIAVVPLFPLCIKRPTTSMWYVTILVLCSSVFLVLAWKRPRSRELAWGVWLPSLCAGAITSWTSDNGLVNAGHGLVPIALAGAALAVERVQSAVGGAARARLELVYPLLMVAVFLGYQRRTFGDDPVATLDTRVEYGPFAGLYTSSSKETYLRQMTSDIASVAGDREYVLFVDHFPAGYLMTDLRPGASCIWTHPCTGWSREDCNEEMRRNIERWPAATLAIVRMHEFPSRRDNLWISDPNEIDRFIESRFRRVLDRPGYSVFVSG
jgi:hypothetical protein